MRQTLFMIDQYLFEDHWILLGWIVISILYMAYQFVAGSRQEAISFVPVIIIVGLLVEFVLPQMSSAAVNLNEPDGPIGRWRSSHSRLRPVF